MSPLIKKALESLAEDCNKSALHIMDEDLIKVTFKALYKNGEILDFYEIHQWAITNGWAPIPAKDLSHWSKVISSGKRVQLKYKDEAPTEKEVLAKLV